MRFHSKGVQVLKGNSGYMLLIPAPLTEDLNNIRIDGDYSIEIKRHSEKRSLNANSYCWPSADSRKAICRRPIYQ